MRPNRFSQLSSTLVTRALAKRVFALLLFLVSCYSFHTNSPGPSLEHSVGVLLGERLRCFQGIPHLDETLLALSNSLELSGFLVTDSDIELVERGLKVIKRVHLLSRSEKVLEDEHVLTGHENMRQWFKQELAFQDMVAYEVERGVSFSHVLKFRSDFIAEKNMLDKLDLNVRGLYMATDWVFFGSREVFPTVLLTHNVILKYWNRFTTYFPIDLRVVADSDLGVGKFQWLCWPDPWFRKIDQRAKIHLFDQINSVFYEKDISPPCRWQGPSKAFSSERVFLLNIFAHNITIHRGIRGALRKERKSCEIDSKGLRRVPLR